MSGPGLGRTLTRGADGETSKTSFIGVLSGEGSQESLFLAVFALDDAQHDVFQLLHQGTVLVPVEFVAVRAGEDQQDPEHHRLLLLSAFAQGAALMEGRPSEDPQRAYSGDRPSSTILLERLEARSLGALIAFYEHRTFANAVMLGINPFDQFGVELGKDIARHLAEDEGTAELDPSTRALMERVGI